MDTPTHFRFTKAEIDKLPNAPAGKRDTYYDTGYKGLQLRMTQTGAKTFSVFARVHGGNPERVTIGKYPAITIEQARTKAKEIISNLAKGDSPSAEKRAKRKAKATDVTLEAALKEYVENKRRKGGLPLKERTQADYLAMVDPGREGKPVEGKRQPRRRPGELWPLAGKLLKQITAEDIRSVHKQVEDEYGERRAGYAMQVLRAVLNRNGTKIAGNPLDPDTAGKERIEIPAPQASDAVVPPERVGALWNAMTAVDSTAHDYLKLTLLCGTRPSELLDLMVDDVDVFGGRVLLRDTKNRRDHKLILSRQALEIVRRHAQGKKPEERLFHEFATPPHRQIKALVKETGIKFNTKVLRATFASTAESLVSYAVLKKLMNHIEAADITGTHYVKISEAQLREGWHKVADWIEAEARKALI